VSEPLCFINGDFIPASQAMVPVHDLGVQRGYCIFDFLRVTQNVPLFCNDHLERFYRSAKEMRLTLKQSKEELKTVIGQLIQKNQLPDSGIRILLSGGASPDGYQLVQPALAIIQQPLTPPADEIYQNGYTLVTYPHQRQIPHVKTTDYLMAIWLQPWMKGKGGDDILYQQNGIVSECPRSNFFIVTQSNTIVTPARNILKGITRKQLLEIAAANGFAMEERDISIDDIRRAKEAFIGSSTKRVIPVNRVDDIEFGPCKDDSVTSRLYDLFFQKEKQAIHDAS
jgi:branched-chain amino acid aminotransferase